MGKCMSLFPPHCPPLFIPSCLLFFCYVVNSPWGMMWWGRWWKMICWSSKTARLEAYRLQGLSLGLVEVAWEHAVTRLLGKLCQEVRQVSLRRRQRIQQRSDLIKSDLSGDKSCRETSGQSELRIMSPEQVRLFISLISTYPVNSSHFIRKQQVKTVVMTSIIIGSSLNSAELGLMLYILKIFY